MTSTRPTLLALAILLFATAALAAPHYIASRLREPFHITSCKWAQRIASSNAVHDETRNEALKDGHRPCKVCNP